MAGKDKEMLKACLDNAKPMFERHAYAHPLDSEVLAIIDKLLTAIGDDDSDYAIYRYSNQIDILWKLLIEKSVKCLRYHDAREPFLKNNNKKPMAYGIEDLEKYYKKYSEFERMLYGSSKFYRDHVVHVIRTWLTGIECLIKNNGAYLDFISIDNGSITVDNAEKISIWTLIALTHDLGYPLEKAQGIINTTRSMMETFVTNPDISMDLAFHGVQNYMNDFIVRLMSSKMIKAPLPQRSGAPQNSKDSTLEDIQDAGEAQEYMARLQPKYYFKFQKSLEQMQHGILSTLIIYKLLTYFLESDYNINEDYRFNEEDRRQFYIRREVLRSIASHTCSDVYHLYMGSFAFLLIIADDTQEWGRKYVSELYVSSKDSHEIGEVEINIAEGTDSVNMCKFSETIKSPENKGAQFVIALISRLVNQSQNYVTLFRDGQDTEKRDFSFHRQYIIDYGAPKISFDMNLSIPKDNASTLKGSITYTTTDKANEIFGEQFAADLQNETGLSVSLAITNSIGKNADMKNPSEWRKGNLSIDLSR